MQKNIVKNRVKKYLVLALALTIASQPEMRADGWFGSLIAQLFKHVQSAKTHIKEHPVPYIFGASAVSAIVAYVLKANWAKLSGKKLAELKVEEPEEPKEENDNPNLVDNADGDQENVEEQQEKERLENLKKQAEEEERIKKEEKQKLEQAKLKKQEEKLERELKEKKLKEQQKKEQVELEKKKKQEAQELVKKEELEQAEKLKQQEKLEEEKKLEEVKKLEKEKLEKEQAEKQKLTEEENREKVQKVFQEITELQLREKARIQQEREDFENEKKLKEKEKELEEEKLEKELKEKKEKDLKEQQENLKKLEREEKEKLEKELKEQQEKALIWPSRCILMAPVPADVANVEDQASVEKEDLKKQELEQILEQAEKLKKEKELKEKLEKELKERLELENKKKQEEQKFEKEKLENDKDLQEIRALKLKIQGLDGAELDAMLCDEINDSVRYDKLDKFKLACNAIPEKDRVSFFTKKRKKGSSLFQVILEAPAGWQQGDGISFKATFQKTEAVYKLISDSYLDFVKYLVEEIKVPLLETDALSIALSTQYLPLVTYIFGKQQGDVELDAGIIFNDFFSPLHQFSYCKANDDQPTVLNISRQELVKKIGLYPCFDYLLEQAASNGRVILPIEPFSGLEKCHVTPIAAILYRVVNPDLTDVATHAVFEIVLKLYKMQKNTLGSFALQGELDNLQKMPKNFYKLLGKILPVFKKYVELYVTDGKEDLLSEISQKIDEVKKLAKNPIIEEKIEKIETKIVEKKQVKQNTSKAEKLDDDKGLDPIAAWNFREQRRKEEFEKKKELEERKEKKLKKKLEKELELEKKKKQEEKKQEEEEISEVLGGAEKIELSEKMKLLISKRDIDGLMLLAKDRRIKLSTDVTDGTILGYALDMNPSGISMGECVEDVATRTVARYWDGRLCEKYMAIIRLLVDKIGAGFSGESVVIALKNQHLPLVEYLLGKEALNVDPKNMVLPVDFEFLFKSGLNASVQHYYVPEGFEQQKVKYNSKLVEKFGFYPCFAAILKYLKQKGCALEKVTVPFMCNGEERRCGLVAGLLSAMASNNGGDTEDFSSMSIFETIIRVYADTQKPGNFDLGNVGKDHYSNLKQGLEKFQVYLGAREPQLEAELNALICKDLESALERVNKVLGGAKKKKESKKVIEEKIEKVEKIEKIEEKIVEKQSKQKEEELNKAQQEIVKDVCEALTQNSREGVVYALQRAIDNYDLTLLKAISKKLSKEAMVKLFTDVITGKTSVFYTVLEKSVCRNNAGYCNVCREGFSKSLSQSIGNYFAVSSIGEEYMAIISYLVEYLNLSLNNVQDTFRYEVCTNNALAIALKKQYLPLIQYLLDKKALEVQQIDMELPINFNLLFNGNFFNKEGQFYYIKDNFDVHQELRYGSALVKDFGFYPCFAAILDYLISKKVDLKTVTVPVRLDEKVEKYALIPSLLYHMKLNNGGDLWDFGSISIFEVVIKIYALTGTLGNFELENGNSVFYKELGSGLTCLQKYLKNREPKLGAELGKKIGEDLAQAIELVGELSKEKQEAISSNKSTASDETSEGESNNEEKEVEISVCEKLYTAIEKADAKTLEKIKIDKKTVFDTASRALELKVNKRKTEFNCPILPWLLYHLAVNKKSRDTICDIILKIDKAGKNKKSLLVDTSKIDLEKKADRRAFYGQLSKGLKALKSYTKENDIEFDKLNKAIKTVGKLSLGKK